MDSYGDFAAVYDTFMDEVPYEQWCDEICGIMSGHGIAPGSLVAELGCGTGSFTRLLKDRGYDCIGIDNSTEMLQVALEKEQDGSNGTKDILYLCQDMREFELYGTVDAIISVCDSINYITEPEELEKVFKLVNNYLNPEGLFIFDFNTKEKYEAIGEAVIAENREDCSFIWENYYDRNTAINTYELTLFLKEEGDYFRRSSELHIQRGYSLEEMKLLLTGAGMEPVSHREREDGHILVAAVSHGKEKI